VTTFPLKINNNDLIFNNPKANANAVTRTGTNKRMQIPGSLIAATLTAMMK
jgi:hypothetical protein